MLTPAPLPWPAIRASLDACACLAYYLSVVNLLPKLALGKLAVENTPTAILLRSKDGGCTILPTSTDTADYYNLVLDLISCRTPLQKVPKWAANALKVAAKITKTDEYLYKTHVLATLPGKTFEENRRLVRRAESQCSVKSYDESDMPDCLTLLSAWYKQNSDRKFRTYGKTETTWLLENWQFAKEQDPHLTCIVVRSKEGKPVSFHIGGGLSNTLWTAHTQRYDRDSGIKGANLLGQRTMALAFSDRFTLENDGTADTPSIKAWKTKLATTTYQSFSMVPK